MQGRPSLPPPRGPLSEVLIEVLREPAHPSASIGELFAAASADPVFGEDFQLSLYLLYELHYRGFSEVDERWEWQPQLLGLRGSLEADFEIALREQLPDGTADPSGLADEVKRLIDTDDSPQLSTYMERTASLDEFREFLIHRSAYQLKEADPHSWAIPRLHGPAKAALVEVQADEYGGGRPDRVHA